MYGNKTLTAPSRSAESLASRFDGAIVVDKPEGWTSHDVVNRVRRLANTKKVGHLGTLDPIATGVLPVVVGRATRLAQFFTRNDKVYEAVVEFGLATTTYDRAGEPLGTSQDVNVQPSDIEAALDQFRGRFLQTPPPVSAKKVDGVPAYKLARKNKPVELEPVEIEVYELSLLSVDMPRITARVHCSAGTYVRSIAHELGQTLGCGAHLAELRRTASGDFHIDQSRTLEDLQVLADDERLHAALIPAGKLLPDFHSQVVDEVTTARIRQGRDFAVSPFRQNRASRYVKAVSRDGTLIAIGELKLPTICHPVIVL